MATRPDDRGTTHRYLGLGACHFDRNRTSGSGSCAVRRSKSACQRGPPAGSRRWLNLVADCRLVPRAAGALFERSCDQLFIHDRRCIPRRRSGPPPVIVGRPGLLSAFQQSGQAQRHCSRPMARVLVAVRSAAFCSDGAVTVRIAPAPCRIRARVGRRGCRGAGEILDTDTPWSPTTSLSNRVDVRSMRTLLRFDDYLRIAVDGVPGWSHCRGTLISRWSASMAML